MNEKYTKIFVIKIILKLCHIFESSINLICSYSLKSLISNCEGKK